MILKQIKQHNRKIIDRALDECINRQLFSATEFIDMVQYLNRQREVTVTKDINGKVDQIKPIYPWAESILQTDTYKRDIKEYVAVLEGEPIKRVTNIIKSFTSW